ncbi:MAG: Hpt domain-containing protein [Spirochaetales bacterium]|jgi:HPt (histidine-containing phosphotransfer) domain-containing protein|nr:Hpt domain-containing protein [Spirochaetales bacterium]
MFPATPLRGGAPPPATPPGLPRIDGIQTEKGLANTGGTLSGYRKVLTVFCADAQERLPRLKEPPALNELPLFTTQVHALKSAAASLGAEELSAKAAALEKAGNSKDDAFIRENLNAFTQELTRLVESILAALAENEESPPAPASAQRELLYQLKDALKNKNVNAIDRILESLQQKPQDAHTRGTLEKISDAVLMTEFEKALQTLDELDGTGGTQ